jgi:hypothetical protein
MSQAPTQIRVPLAQRRRLYPDPVQAVLRLMVLAGVLAALAAAVAAGARPTAWVQVVVVGLAAFATVRPDSVAGIVALGGTAYVWALSPEPLSPLVLVVAAGMLLTHLAALVAAQGPALLRVDPGQVRLWLWRGFLLWLAAVAVWGLALAVQDHPGGRSTYAVGLLLLAALAVVGTRLMGRRVG